MLETSPIWRQLPAIDVTLAIVFKALLTTVITPPALPSSPRRVAKGT